METLNFLEVKEEWGRHWNWELEREAVRRGFNSASLLHEMTLLVSEGTELSPCAVFGRERLQTRAWMRFLSL